MAKPKTLRWTKLSIWPGDGADPEVFASKACGLTTKGIAFSAETADSNVPDCDDPDLPSWTERVVRALSASVSGSGIMAEETYAFWRDWFLSGASKNVHIIIDGTDIAGYFAGAYVLTAFETGANEADGKINVSLTLVSDGEVTWEDDA